MGVMPPISIAATPVDSSRHNEPKNCVKGTPRILEKMFIYERKTHPFLNLRAFCPGKPSLATYLDRVINNCIIFTGPLEFQ
mmetsp:Transcript_6031/g.14621  ORF Transcript_6031/g.14621 Transcript_6031/m.14621 type:complete len:81 (-) Transcript_6031:1678-1920(-)